MTTQSNPDAKSDTNTPSKIVKLTARQQVVLDAAKEGQSLFITGCAGTGKTVLVNAIRSSLAHKRIAVTGMSGPASIIIGGQTLHSFLCLGRDDNWSGERALKLAEKESVQDAVGDLDVLIIDEVSMMSDEMFDFIECEITRARELAEGCSTSSSSSSSSSSATFNFGNGGGKRGVAYRATSMADEDDEDDDESESENEEVKDVVMADDEEEKDKGEEEKKEAADKSEYSGEGKSSNKGKTTQKFPKPFGGLQLILCGDFFQLGPVSKNNKDVGFCFESSLWNLSIDKVFVLEESMRQKEDLPFAQLLQRVREGKPTPADLAALQKRVGAPLNLPPGIRPTILYAKRDEADAENQSELAKLPGEEVTYRAVPFAQLQQVTKNGEESLVEHEGDLTLQQQRALTALLDGLNSPAVLTLKKGAQVMLTANLSIKDGFANGSRGVIIDFVREQPEEGREVILPVVKFVNGKKMIVRSILTREKDPVTSIYLCVAQLPLMLAFASTVHKAQGMTLDAIQITMANMFAKGQFFVALSRAKRLDCVTFTDFIKSKITMVSHLVREFYERVKEGGKGGLNDPSLKNEETDAMFAATFPAMKKRQNSAAPARKKQKRDIGKPRKQPQLEQESSHKFNLLVGRSRVSDS